MEFTKKFIINKNNMEYLSNVFNVMGFIYNIKSVTSNKEKEIKSKVTVEFNGKTYSIPEGYDKLYEDIWRYLEHNNSNNQILCIFKVTINGEDEKEVSEELQKNITKNTNVLLSIIMQFFKNIFNKNKTKE